MNQPASPPLKSPSKHDRPHPAEPAARPAAVGDRKSAARKGVLSALRPDPHPSSDRYPVAWLTIPAPGRSTVPTAHSWCRCGRDRSAVGHRQVRALIAAHIAHRTACPLRTTVERATA